jgi:phosphoserine aminotransferase
MVLNPQIIKIINMKISFTFYDILYCSYMKNLQDTNHIQLILQSSIFNNLNQYYFDKFLYYLKLKELKENSYMLKGKKING